MYNGVRRGIASYFDKEAKAMENALTGELSAEEIAQMQTAMQQHFAEIEQLRERMQRDQSEIESSGARTDAMLKQIQAHLARLQAS